MTQYINSVQSFSITLSSATSGTATITGVGANAFIIYGGYTATGAAVDVATSEPYLQLTNNTTVTATITSSGSCVVWGCVVDPTSNLVSSVQQGTITMTGTASNTATITSVTTTSSVVFFLGADDSRTTVGQYAGADPWVVLTNATTVTANRGNSTGNATVGYVVVSFNPSALQSNVQVFATTETGTTTTQTITSVTANNTMLVWQGVENQSGLPGFTQVPWITLTNGTTVTLTQQTSGNYTCFYTVVEFVSGVLSQAAQYGSITLTAATSNTATITSAATTRSACTYLGSTGTGTTDATTSMAVTLTNATTVTGTLTTAATGTVGYGVFTFTGASPGQVFMEWMPQYN